MTVMDRMLLAFLHLRQALAEKQLLHVIILEKKQSFGVRRELLHLTKKK